LRFSNVAFLASLVAAAQQDDQIAPAPREIEPVSGPWAMRSSLTPSPIGFTSPRTPRSSRPIRTRTRFWAMPSRKPSNQTLKTSV